MVQDYQVVNKSVVTTAGGADRPLHGWLCIGAVKIVYSIVISIVDSNNAVVTNICTWNVFFLYINHGSGNKAKYLLEQLNRKSHGTFFFFFSSLFFPQFPASGVS